MEKMLTVTEVTRTYGVSARMLRHYEKLGLIASGRREGYAYRVYRPEIYSVCARSWCCGNCGCR